jgi:hypothetical protein
VAAQTAAEAARDAAVTARMTAEAAQKVAEDAAAAAMAAEMTAKAAQATAEADLKTAQAAQKKAEDDLATAIMERDDAMAQLNMEDDAESAQRARIDAAAINRAAGDTVVRTVVGNTVVSTSTIKSHVIAGFQGNAPIPGDGTAVMPVAEADTDNGLMNQTGQYTPGLHEVNRMGRHDGNNVDDADSLMENESLSLTASRVGDTVSFKAVADTNTTDKVDGDTLISFDATADADGMTRGTDKVELDGGLTKHIYLVSDIEAPLSRAFGKNVPAGLGNEDTDPVEADRLPGSADSLAAVHFDPVTQTYRYVVLVPDGGAFGPPGGDTFDADGDATGVQPTMINVDDHAGIDLTLPAALTPSDAAPTAEVQDAASVPGSYAGVPGMYRCADSCSLTRDADTSELLMLGVWQFVPESDPVSIADSDYLIYGAWLKKPDSTVGTGASAGLGVGSDLFDSMTGATDDANGSDNGITELTGIAKYTGHAAGFFAERHVNSNTAASGTFTATAELTANFDGGSDVGDRGDAAVTGRPTPADNLTPDNNPGVISGMIKDFVRNDGGDADWVVTLRTIDLGARIDDPTSGTAADVILAHPSAIKHPGGFAAGATGGTASGAPWSGEWGMQFSGNGTDGTQHPGGVSGTFGAAAGSSSRLVSDVEEGGVADAGFVGVIGGFGARKE